MVIEGRRWLHLISPRRIPVLRRWVGAPNARLIPAMLRADQKKPPPSFARRARLARSLRLLASFRFEQTDPARFYREIAVDTVALVGDFYRDLTGSDLTGTIVVDVGGGPGYFANEFAAAGARYLSVEPDLTQLTTSDAATVVCGSGVALPVRDNAVDVCMSSNVAEHIRYPWAMADEMLRVTKPGGLVVFSYTTWLGPFGGHETGPWHYLGGQYAARRYRRRHGRQPKNRYGVSLFAVRVVEGLRWARRSSGQARTLAAFPRYHPHWAWWLVRVPVLREFLVSNLVVVAAKTAA